MELNDYRARLDVIDRKILSLFAERMDIVAEIARWKQENRVPVLDSGREEEKLRQVEAESPPELAVYSRK
ncbi:MAG: chorismate mutase, partial [Oscillospiraceae bacterium]|nr:chorismate mutase [Oscillospiraceae bacterium]